MGAPPVRRVPWAHGDFNERCPQALSARDALYADSAADSERTVPGSGRFATAPFEL